MSVIAWLRWVPVAAYATLIFVLSSNPRPALLPGLDKLIHVGEYCLFAGLLYWALVGSLQGRLGRVDALTVILTTLYGMSDEIHQFFVPGRTAEAVDVLADCFGALLCVYGLRARRKAHVQHEDKA